MGSFDQMINERDEKDWTPKGDATRKTSNGFIEPILEENEEINFSQSNRSHS